MSLCCINVVYTGCFNATSGNLVPSNALYFSAVMIDCIDSINHFFIVGHKVFAKGSDMCPASSSLLHYEVVYVIFENPAFCIVLYLTGIHFWDKLQHVGHVGGQKNQVLTNQSSKNRWCQIARGTICYVCPVSFHHHETEL